MWDDFADAGYRTMFLEEFDQCGLFVYPDLKGFQSPPVDYWPRAVTVLQSRSKYLSCLDGVPMASLYQNYVFGLLKLLEHRQPLWAMSWLGKTTHDDARGGFVYDEPVLDFLSRMDSEGILNKTVVLFFADHGLRYGSFRETEQGRDEDSLPLGFLILPPAIAAKRPDIVRNLQTNSKRLVTSFDLRETLLEIIRPARNRVAGDERPPKGISLFSQEIPPGRTCTAAHIQPEHCPCSNRQRFNDTELAFSIGMKATAYLNKALRESQQTSNGTHACSFWKPQTVSNIVTYTVGKEGTVIFQIHLRTSPPATFEVTATLTNSSWALNEVRCLSSSDPDIHQYCGRYRGPSQLFPLFQVARIDRYGKNAYCATGKIRHYCYCVRVRTSTRFTGLPA